MSRVAKTPIPVPKGVEVNIGNFNVAVKGPNGALELDYSPVVGIELNDGILTISNKGKIENYAIAGTTRALLANIVHGVSQGFVKKLVLVGVGYRAQIKGNVLNMTLGFSHPIDFQIPEGITIETPSPTEIIVKGIDKQLVGQVCAIIRAYRPPEPYKGKGVRYENEIIVRKEAKKK
jgi:large subunit ribosomal protein L6